MRFRFYLDPCYTSCLHNFAVGTTGVGIYALPATIWVKAFMSMGLLFTVGSTFSLAKTMRDKHESEKLIGRVSEAKTEKLLRDYELTDVA